MSYFNIILQNFPKGFFKKFKRYVVWCNRHAIPWNEIILALSFHLKGKILYPTLYNHHLPKSDQGLVRLLE